MMHLHLSTCSVCSLLANVLLNTLHHTYVTQDKSAGVQIEAAGCVRELARVASPSPPEFEKVTSKLLKV